MINNAKKFTLKSFPPAPQSGIILGVDPALAAYAGFVVASFDADHLSIVDGGSVGALMNYDSIFDQIEHFAQKWRPSEVIIESNAIQGGIARDSRIDALKTKYMFEVREHQTSFNKFDDKIGVASMAGAFRRNEISIAWGDADATEKMEQLIRELTNWRPDVPTRALRQDFVMAMWFVYLRWLQKRPFMREQISSFSRGAQGGISALDMYKRYVNAR